MKNNTLFDLIENAKVDYWREELKNDTIACFDEKENETKDELLKELPESCRKVLSHYAFAIENRMDYLHYNLHIKILNLGIKIGMELQDEFLSYEE